MAGGALSCIPLDASGDMVQLAADVEVNRIPRSLFCMEFPNEIYQGGVNN